MITNNAGLPKFFTDILSENNYDKGDADYSVSQLITPVQAAILRMRHNDEVVEDFTDMLKRVQGTALHEKMEKHAKSNGLMAHKRFFAQVLDKTISGEIDVYDEESKTLWDLKNTSVWSKVFADKPNSVVRHWESQTNIYSWLLRQHGHPVERIKIIVSYTDMRPSEQSRYDKYPAERGEVLDMPLWNDEFCKEFIQSKVHLLSSSECLADSHLPKCSPQEMDESPTVYAVYKGENKRATRLFDTIEKAEYMAKSASYWHVKTRPGTRSICEKVCRVKEFCYQHREYIDEKNNMSQG